MTGFGRGLQKEGDLEITAEIRSVNNRFLDVIVKTPRSLSNFEQQIREIVGKYTTRGRVNVWIGITADGEKYQELVLNKSLVQTYLSIADELKTLHVPGNVDVNQLLTLPDILTVNNDTDTDENTWNCVRQAVITALAEMNKMRQAEGAELNKDFVERINQLNDMINQVEQLAELTPREELDKLRARVKRLVPDEVIDENRLEMELAIIADRVDTTEECVRFNSHNKLFLDLLKDENSQGRKLNFLLQEMNREANTIGSKTSDPKISHLVVQIKDQVEKIREQIQNIE